MLPVRIDVIMRHAIFFLSTFLVSYHARLIASEMHVCFCCVRIKNTTIGCNCACLSVVSTFVTCAFIHDQIMLRRGILTLILVEYPYSYKYIYWFCTKSCAAAVPKVQLCDWLHV
jgi:hypothetical protein